MTTTTVPLQGIPLARHLMCGNKPAVVTVGGREVTATITGVETGATRDVLRGRVRVPGQRLPLEWAVDIWPGTVWSVRPATVEETVTT